MMSGIDSLGKECQSVDSRNGWKFDWPSLVAFLAQRIVHSHFTADNLTSRGRTSNWGYCNDFVIEWSEDGEGLLECMREF